jgi:hypothetical protein
MRVLDFLIGVTVLVLAADKSFVYLYLIIQIVVVLTTETLANPLEHEPRCFLRNVNIAGELKRGNTLFVGRNEPDSHEPLDQLDFGVVKQGVCADIEILACIFTTIFIALAFIDL